MNDDINRQLEDWGSDDPPGPNADFAERLEADLRSAAYFGHGTVPPEPGGAGWLERLLRPGVVIGASFALVLLAVVFLGTRSSEDPDILVIEDASGTTVTVPGASGSSAAAGTRLPDGTVIEVSPLGFAVIDGVVLPADSRAVVVDGHLELHGAEPTPVPTQTPAAPSTPTPPPNDGADNSDDGFALAPLPTPTASAASPTPASTTSSAAPTATPEQTTTADDDTATGDPAGAATPGPTDVTVQEPTPDPTEVAVDVRPSISLGRRYLGPERAVLAWIVSDKAGVRGWEVRIRRGDTVKTAAVIRQRNANELVVQRPERARVFYSVVAVGADGERLAVSNEVRVTRGEGGDG